MAEYIEREAALYRAKSFLANHIDGIVAEHAQLPYETCNATEFARGYERGAIDAVKVVLSTPAADVVPVKHGRWIPLEADGYADGFPVWDLWECSECQEEHSGDEDTLTPYCPNCGAKMDLEVTNGLDQH